MKSFHIKWILANAIGFSLAFLAFLQFLMFYAHGLNFELHWDFEAQQNLARSESFIITGISIGLTLLGIILTSAQALIIRKYLPKIWPWILNGALGFAIISLIIWPLRNIWGSIPGPVEPLTITVGGLIFTIIFQWRLLKKNGIKATKPILMYATGTFIGAALLFPLFYIILGDVPWALQMCITGLVIGASAGALSSKTLLNALRRAVSD